MDLLSIGNFIAQLRKQNGLTQEQLGEQIGVTNKTVSRWERSALRTKLFPVGKQAYICPRQMP